MDAHEDIRIEVDDRVICIPRALPETIKIMQELVAMRDEMIIQSERARDKYNPDDIYASPECCYEKIYYIRQEYDDRYSRKLAEEYNAEYFAASIGSYMPKYHAVCKSASQKIASAWRRQAEFHHLGLEVAEEVAQKEIKGMPFGIITSSFSSALLYTGMSALTYASQAKRADRIYEKTLKQYKSNDAVYYEMKTLAEEVFPLIYPVAEKTTAEFLEDVLVEIDENCGIGYKELDKKHKTKTLIDDINYIYGDTIALRKSMSDLESISDDTCDYEKILDILEECPYCPEIYVKIIQMGIFDERIFRIAKILNIEKKILLVLEKEVEERKADIDYIKPILKIIAEYKSQPFEKVLRNTYHDTINRIKNDYHELYLLCVLPKRLNEWILKCINSNMDKVIMATKEDIESRVNWWIENNVKDSELIQLHSMGLLTIEDVRMKDSNATTLDDVKTEYTGKLISQIMEYIKEANLRKRVYEDAYKKFNSELQEKQKLLSGKQQELSQQGLFAFSKKKEIKTEIDHLQQETEDFRKTEPVELKKAYYEMYA